jgi:glycosyltransferase involved in cell wall biosynthesis
MRIAIVGSHGGRVGGTETYLSRVNLELAAAGHDTAFWHEFEAPTGSARVAIAPGAPRWCAAQIGAAPALDALERWRPDVIYAHGLSDVGLEERMLALAPIVFHAHNYHGACVSGRRMYASPDCEPCHRRFGAACLALYYPRRCGGWHPVTLLRDFRRQRRRLRFVRRCAAVVASSRYVAEEYVKHGVDASRVVALALPIGAPEIARASATDQAPHVRDTWRLLFLGRMDDLKGGGVFLGALPAILDGARCRVQVTFAGDGRARDGWSRQARTLERRLERLTIHFTGWLDEGRCDEMLLRTDLLVVPSLWPEPFGLVGLEAARAGVPAAAFDVGGISEWLTHGVNGHLAPGDPPTAAGLAHAIVDCLRDPAHHARLRAGAAALAHRVSREAHGELLCRVLAAACDDARPGVAVASRGPACP